MGKPSRQFSLLPDNYFVQLISNPYNLLSTVDVFSFYKGGNRLRKVKLGLVNGRVQINSQACLTPKPKAIHSIDLPYHYLCKVSSEREGEEGVLEASTLFLAV